jgi:hypothetical protein
VRLGGEASAKLYNILAGWQTKFTNEETAGKHLDANAWPTLINAFAIASSLGSGVAIARCSRANCPGQRISPSSPLLVARTWVSRPDLVHASTDFEQLRASIDDALSRLEQGLGEIETSMINRLWRLVQDENSTAQSSSNTGAMGWAAFGLGTLLTLATGGVGGVLAGSLIGAKCLSRTEADAELINTTVHTIAAGTWMLGNYQVLWREAQSRVDALRNQQLLRGVEGVKAGAPQFIYRLAQHHAVAAYAECALDDLSRQRQLLEGLRSVATQDLEVLDRMVAAADQAARDATQMLQDSERELIGILQASLSSDPNRALLDWVEKDVATTIQDRLNKALLRR